MKRLLPSGSRVAPRRHSWHPTTVVNPILAAARKPRANSVTAGMRYRSAISAEVVEEDMGWCSLDTNIVQEAVALNEAWNDIRPLQGGQESRWQEELPESGEGLDPGLHTSGFDEFDSGPQAAIAEAGDDGDAHIKRPRFGENVWYEEALLHDVTHPHIINCFGTNTDGTELWLEKADMDLYTHIAEAEDYQLPDSQVVEIARDVTNALCHIHAKGYAHNDIKAENVVMCPPTSKSHPHGVPKLIDFEFAHKVTEVPPEGEEHIAGTEAYFSPEKWRDDSEYCRQAADVWALGVTLHLAAFGKFPNGTVEPTPVLKSNYEAPPSTDPKLAAILEGFLKFNPDERWSASDGLKFILETDAVLESERTRRYSEPNSIFALGSLLSKERMEQAARQWDDGLALRRMGRAALRLT